ncbi:hypothetical protein K469DRAFT_643145 [Zopfia rhizophila CBS 207.26]|uniref:Uncharacterized protein n=1 Tax=Zopfia rhizophila CBS 207.26 TaxID=1314779 RepID=A0A6A6DGV4_9PEZI|nr:hypothetical protein K469DRAFT_643145 [Zopfia rhizophila CBS 207.26]
MNSSTRLYARLEQIPQDSEDPESLDELVVCAFGVFERYYVCWKNRGGEYRQDGYDLPQSLHAWLFPSDGSTRDFPTLQVVFGRGDEYFASDKDGKLENKEPEIMKPQHPPENLEQLDKPALRRSRTLSFIRPTSDPIVKPVSTAVETSHRESVNRVSIPVIPQPTPRPKSVLFNRPSSDPMMKPFSPVCETPTRETLTMSPIAINNRSSRRPLSMSYHPGTFLRIVEEGKATMTDRTQKDNARKGCTCGCHTLSPRPSYTNASVQTDPEPPQKSLRVDTASETPSMLSRSNRSSISEIQTPIDTPLTEASSASNQVFMGRMLDYFNAPGYRLGDSLRSTYYIIQQQPVCQDENFYQEGWKTGVMGRRQTV